MVITRELRVRRDGSGTSGGRAERTSSRRRDSWSGRRRVSDLSFHTHILYESSRELDPRYQDIPIYDFGEIGVVFAPDRTRRDSRKVRRAKVALKFEVFWIRARRACPDTRAGMPTVE